MRCEAAVREALGPQALAVRSQTYYLDITPPGSDKGTFVQAMARRLEISTDAVATMPGPVASVLARELDMQLAKPPIKLPEFEIAQYWHERFDRDPGNQWLRSVINAQFGGGKSPAKRK